MEHYSKILSILSIVICSLCTPLLSYSQTIITGSVTSEGEGLIGATIQVEGTSRGTVSGSDGNFSIGTTGSDSVLVFSYVGFVTQRVAISGQTTIQVELELAIESLGEVVVVGYGTVQKSDLTGAVASIKSKDLNAGAIQTVEQGLQGRVAGVQISQTSSEPGGGISIRVRGVGSITGGTQPLYVIDGVPINNAALLGGTTRGIAADNNASNPLASINPNDIASIEVLKDASATAIYGARGANGVVLITTKRGSVGVSKVNIDHYTGVQSVYEQADVLSTEGYIALQNDINPGFVSGGASTDWLDEVTQDAIVTNTNFSVSNGNEGTQYFLSANYFKQDGILRNTSSERYSFRVNLESELSSRLSTEINLTNSFQINNPASEGANQNDRGAYTNAAQYNPTIAARNPDGTLNVQEDSDFLNPLAFIEGQSIEARTNRVLGNIGLNYDIAPSLVLSGKVGIDRQVGRRDVVVDSVARLNSPNVTAQALNQERSSVLLEATATYNTSIADFDLNMVAGTTYEEFQFRGFNALGEGFFTADISVDRLQGGFDSLVSIGSSRVQSQLASQFFRVNSTYKNKLLITASIRRDGSSRFGENNKWGIFPSAAVGYKLHEEFALPSFVNQLKVRGSYGISGNNVSENYLSLNGYEFFTFTNPDTGQEQQGIRQVRDANPDLKWETTAQLNIGIDYSLFDARLTGSIDYFHKNTDDLIASLNTAGSTGGTGRIVENSARMVNEGIEFTISSINIEKPDFTWNTDFQLATLRNEVKDLGNRENIRNGNLFASPFTITQPGQPIGSYYMHQVIGVFQSEEQIMNTPYADPNIDEVGDFIFLDANGDNQITDADRVIVGNPLPDVTFGVRNSFTYKRFGLDIFIDGQFGAELANANITTAIYPQEIDRNRLAVVAENRWTPENPTNEYPSLNKIAARAGTNRFNSSAIEDASFVRIQSIRLNYNLILESSSVSNINFYVTGQNLFYFTEYSGLNPEANTNGQNQLAVVDLNPYPIARTFLAGLSITF